MFFHQEKNKRYKERKKRVSLDKPSIVMPKRFDIIKTYKHLNLFFNYIKEIELMRQNNILNS